MSSRTPEILLVEDNPGDIRLTEEAFKESKWNGNLHVVNDGEEALSYLYREGAYADMPRPNLILLDLNMPRKGGRELLREIKNDRALSCIPVVVLTTSRSGKDVSLSYELQANCYIVKPIDFDEYSNVIKAIEEFWFSIALLPECQDKPNSKIERNIIGK